MLTFIRYIEVYYSVRYNENLVISRFCSADFTLIFVGLKKIVCYIEDFVT